MEWHKKQNLSTLYGAILESVGTYGYEIWDLSQKSTARLKAVEIYFWRRSCGVSEASKKLRNSKKYATEQATIVDRIETRQLQWYGHLQHMVDIR